MATVDAGLGSARGPRANGSGGMKRKGQRDSRTSPRDLRPSRIAPARPRWSWSNGCGGLSPDGRGKSPGRWDGPFDGRRLAHVSPAARGARTRAARGPLQARRDWRSAPSRHQETCPLRRDRPSHHGRQTGAQRGHGATIVCMLSSTTIPTWPVSRPCPTRENSRSRAFSSDRFAGSAASRSSQRHSLQVFQYARRRSRPLALMV